MAPTALGKGPKTVICIVGLGYVGLPLALKFAKHFRVIGFDIGKERVDELNRNFDRNLDLAEEDFLEVSKNIEFTVDEKKIEEGDIVVVAVPTPTTKDKKPDLRCLESASKTVGRNLKKGAIVVYESTTYPGCTEDFCLPILERESGMKLGDFYLGYSPERVNPGDKEHTVDKIYKVVAGCNDEVSDLLAEAYSKVTKVHKAPSIKIAESAKVIENVQRDINIALFNEFAMLFDTMGLDSKEIFNAAATKWNFMKFHPGFVGGHCIPVDPYYLAQKALEVGYHPELILSGRRVNESLANYVAQKIVKLIVSAGKAPKETNVLILGATYKENVPDLRDSKVELLISELKGFGIETIDVSEPMIGKDLIFGAKNVSSPLKYDAIVYAVDHKEFGSLDIEGLLKNKGVVADLKRKLNPEAFLGKGHIYWGL
jgi:UDP-N-acetyl-D-galactosamine dehydrogenase